MANDAFQCGPLARVWAAGGMKCPALSPELYGNGNISICSSKYMHSDCLTRCVRNPHSQRFEPCASANARSSRRLFPWPIAPRHARPVLRGLDLQQGQVILCCASRLQDLQFLCMVGIGGRGRGCVNAPRPTPRMQLHGCLYPHTHMPARAQPPAGALRGERRRPQQLMACAGLVRRGTRDPAPPDAAIGTR